MPATDAQVERLIEQEMGCGRKGRNQLTWLVQQNSRAAMQMRKIHCCMVAKQVGL